MKCPSCGAAGQDGRFCSSCGAALAAPHCSGCGHKPPAGAKFCNQCGQAMGGTARAPGSGVAGSGNQAAWAMAGALVLGLILVVTYPLYGPGGTTTAPVGAPPGPAAGPAGVDLGSMTPRQAADRLFNRVMTAVSTNNSAEVQQFLPMAIAALDLVVPLDTDGQFHRVLLQLTGQMNDEALAGAEEILSEQPDHLLGLAMAGDASLALGDSASARAYYARWLDAYDAERQKDLVEYRDHGPMFPEMQAKAEALGRE